MARGDPWKQRKSKRTSSARARFATLARRWMDAWFRGDFHHRLLAPGREGSESDGVETRSEARPARCGGGAWSEPAPGPIPGGRGGPCAPSLFRDGTRISHPSSTSHVTSSHHPAAFVQGSKSPKLSLQRCPSPTCRLPAAPAHRISQGHALSIDARLALLPGRSAGAERVDDAGRCEPSHGFTRGSCRCCRATACEVNHGACTRLGL